MRKNSDLEDKVLEIIKENNLIEPGDKVLIGVSGGPDSICLLNILAKLKDELKISLHVAHLNHLYRGVEAEKDMKFVEDFSKKLGLPVTSKKVNVKKFALEEGLSIEDAGRRLRYQFFNDLAREISANKIALGHTADDNIETVLMRLITGSGSRGLLGIPIKRGIIVRPLLNFWRKEIESYCRHKKLKTRIDRSNFDIKFLRNKIRHKVLPILESINPNFKNALKQTIEMLSSDYEYLLKISQKALNSATIHKKEDLVRLDVDKLLMYPDSIKRYVLRLAIEGVKGDLENISYSHIEEILSKLSIGKKWEIHLPSQIIVSGDGDRLEIKILKAEVKPEIKFEYKLKVPGTTIIKELGAKIKTEIIKVPKVLKLKNKNEAIVDFNKTGNKLIVRNRRIGDRFSPFGIIGSKKLKDFFIDEKVPSSERDKIPIIESNGKIVWVAGYRIDNYFRITPKTKKAIRLVLV